MSGVVLADIAPAPQMGASRDFMVWRGNTAYAAARFVNELRQPVAVSQVSFIWRHPATGLEVTIPGIPDAPADQGTPPPFWRSAYVPELTGYWAVAALSMNPARQLDWMGFVVAPGPGADDVSDSALWLTQENSILASGQGLLISAVRIDQFEITTDAAGLVMPVIRLADGKTYRISFEDLLEAATQKILAPVLVRLDALEASQATQDATLAQHTTALADHGTRLDAHDASLADLADKAENGAARDLEHAQQIADLLAADQTHLDRLNGLQAATDELAEQLGDVKPAVDDLTTLVGDLRTTTQGLSQDLDQAAQDIASLGDQQAATGVALTTLEGRVTPLEAKTQAHEQAITDLDTVVRSLQGVDENGQADLSALTQRVTGAEQATTALTARVADLEGDREPTQQALTRIGNTADDALAQAQQAGRDVVDLDARLDEAEGHVESLQQGLGTTQQKVQELEGRLDAGGGSQVPEGLEARLDGFTNRLDGHDARLDATDAKVAEHTGRLDTQGATLAPLPGRITSAEQAAAGAQQTANTAQQSIPPLVARIGDAEQAAQALSATVAQQGDRVQEAQQGVVNLQGRLDTVETITAPLPGRLTTLEGSVAPLPGRLTSAEQNAAALGIRVEQNDSAIGQARQDIAAAGTRLDSLGTSLTQAQQALAGFTAGQQAQDAALAALQNLVDQLKEQVEDLTGIALYIPPEITSFTVAPTQAEIGTSTNAVLTIVRNRTDLPVVITGPASATIPAGQNTVTLPGPFGSTSLPFTATVTDPAAPQGRPGTATRQAKTEFLNRAYMGLAAGPVPTNAEIIGAISRGFAKPGDALPGTLVTAAGQHVFYAQPAAWPAYPYLTIEGWETGDFTEQVRAVTPAQAGATATSYRVRTMNNPYTATDILVEVPAA